MRRVGDGTKWGTLVACYGLILPMPDPQTEAAPGQNYGHAVSNPRMRAC